MTPIEAYYLALKQGPSVKTREVACQDPYWAHFYLHDIDQCLHPVTLPLIPPIELDWLRERFDFD